MSGIQVPVSQTNGNGVKLAYRSVPQNQEDPRSDFVVKEGSRWSRVYQITIAILILVVVILVASLLYLHLSSKTEETCITEGCITAAARMKSAMDMTVDPCHDFYEYACGTWNRKNVIPEDRPTYNTFAKLGDEVQVKLKGLLEEDSLPGEAASILYAKNLYRSCLNQTHIETLGIRPLTEFLEELGGWPIINDTYQLPANKYYREDLIGHLRLYGNHIFIQMGVSPDDRDSSKFMLHVDQPKLGMPAPDYYLNPQKADKLGAYRQFATEVASILYTGSNPDRIKTDVEDIIQLEIKLANLTIPQEDRRDAEALYHKMSIRDLNTNYSHGFDWLYYIKKVFANRTSVVVELDEPIVAYAPTYLREMTKLMNQTSARTLINYAIWRIVVNRVNYLPRSFLDIRQRYNKVLMGTESDRARWRTCVADASDNFGFAVGRLFVEKYFKDGSKATALEMIGNIRHAFIELLDEVEWMDEETRKVAVEKANAIDEKIGYPDFIMNNTRLDMEYEGMAMEPDQYFRNYLRTLFILQSNNLDMLRKPVDKNKWSTYPAVVNAFYSATLNQISFPAGIFQPPFYQENYPKSLNYGGIFMVTGHEITHGFDDKGRQFDKEGNLKQWWSDEVIERFKEKAQCIIDQYSNYTIPEVPGLHLNGRLTVGENLADNGGLKQAFRAYRRWVANRGSEEASLPSLNLTNNQLFFLNFAQIWCGSSRKESYEQTVSVGRHSPGRFRVIGTLSNSYHFAEAFSCPRGSPMNPERKCQVW